MTSGQFLGEGLKPPVGTVGSNPHRSPLSPRARGTGGERDCGERGRRGRAGMDE